MASKKESGGSAGEEQEKGSSKSKLIIIVVAALALLGGGGFFGYSKFFKSHAEEAPQPAQSAQPVIFDWEPFIVNLADAGGKRYLKMTMKLELTGPSVLEEFTNRGFEMKDSMIMILSSKEFEDLASPSGKTSLKKEMIAQLNKIVKTGQVKEIYFTDFIIQ